MPKDYAALQNALATDPRYATAVQSPSLGPLLTLLNEDEVGQTVARAVPVADVREAIGDGVRGLNAAQVQTLRLMVPDSGKVDFSQTNIRNEIREVLTGKTDALARLTVLATRTRTYGEAFGFTQVTKQDLAKVLPNIPGSDLAKFFARHAV